MMGAAGAPLAQLVTGDEDQLQIGRRGRPRPLPRPSSTSRIAGGECAGNGSMSPWLSSLQSTRPRHTSGVSDRGEFHELGSGSRCTHAVTRSQLAGERHIGEPGLRTQLHPRPTSHQVLIDPKKCPRQPSAHRSFPVMQLLYAGNRKEAIRVGRYQNPTTTSNFSGGSMSCTISS